MLVGRVGHVGIADSKAGLIAIKRIKREDVIHVFFGSHPHFECGLGAGMATEDGLDLVCLVKSDPLNGEAVSGSRDVIIRAEAIGIDVIEIRSASHVGGTGTGGRSQAGIPYQAGSFLPRVSPGQGCHLSFDG